MITGCLPADILIAVIGAILTAIASRYGWKLTLTKPEPEPKPDEDDKSTDVKDEDVKDDKTK